jgi:serine/threonine-protein kinase
VIHRDIKPANIFLVDTEDGELFVKLLDFGVAKLTGTDLNMTASGAMVGTPYYASPEQLLDSKSIDHRTDLWALGVVAYASLTGKLPFLGSSFAELAITISKGNFDPPTVVRSELPRGLDDWMRRALSREREGRFDSAMAMARSFAEALQGGYVDPSPSSALPLGTVMMGAGEGDGPSLHAPSVSGALPASALAAEPLLHQSSLSPMAAQPLAPAAPYPRSGSRVMIALAAVVGTVALAAAVGFAVARSSPESDALSDDEAAATDATAAPGASSPPAIQSADTDKVEEPPAGETADPEAPPADAAPPSPRHAPLPPKPPTTRLPAPPPKPAGTGSNPFGGTRF